METTGETGPTEPAIPEKSSRPSRRSPEDPQARRLRLEQEAATLQASLRDGVMSDLKAKVAWILNLYPQTRNSDVALTFKYWELFQSEIFNPNFMRPRDLFRLERQTSIVRVRAKIQNEYNLFPAEEGIRRGRRSLEEDVKEEVIEDKPARNLVLVFADETGKTGAFICVAAVWVLTGHALFKLDTAIRAWQENSPWGGREIHFSEFKKSHMPALREYLNLIAQHREYLSFKVIAMERATTKRPIDEVVRRLHEFMLIRGAEHEVQSNRIGLPHEIRLTVDAEQSLDAIACADIKEKVGFAYRARFDDQLSISDVASASSHQSTLIQLADIIAGAVNRRKNHAGEPGHKDDMATLIIEQ